MKVQLVFILFLCLSCSSNDCSESASYRSNIEAVMYRHPNGKPSSFFEIENCYPSGVSIEFYDNGLVASYGYYGKGVGSNSEWLIYDTAGMLLCKQIHKNGIISTVSTVDGKVVFLSESSIIMNSNKKKLQLMKDSITYRRRSDLKIYYNHDTIIFESYGRKIKLDSNLNILSTQYNDLPE